MLQELDDLVICKTEAFELKCLGDDILHFEYYDNLVITIEHVTLAYDLYLAHSNQNQMKVLLSFGEFSSITTEARQYAEKKVMPTPAQAIIIKNLAQRMLAKFYQIFRKDRHPLQFFSEIKAALVWLKQH
jgi:hypothetical protein